VLHPHDSRNIKKKEEEKGRRRKTAENLRGKLKHGLDGYGEEKKAAPKESNNFKEKVRSATTVAC